MNEVFVMIGIFVVGLIVIALFATLPIYFLWNWLMPEIFGLVKITFWQALGLALLSGSLFGRTGISGSK